MEWTIDHTSRDRLQDQIAGCVRRGVASGALSVGEQLPPAPSWRPRCRSTATPCSPPTGSSATRGCSSSGAGAGHAWWPLARPSSSVTEAARALIATGREHGLGTNDLVRIIKELT